MDSNSNVADRFGDVLYWFCDVWRSSPRADEGAAAHLFQIWLAVEVLMVAFFAIKWLPLAPTQALLILAIQIVAALAACAPVYFLNL